MADGKIVIQTLFEVMGLESVISQASNKITLGITAAAVAAGQALADLAKDVIQVGSDFESAMSNVAATMGTTVDQIPEISAKAKELGANTKFTATEAAEGFNILAQAGLDLDEQLNTIDATLALAAAGEMDMDDAAGYLTTTMKAMSKTLQENGQDANYVADMYAKGATLANTSTAEFGEAMQGAAAMAGSYNQTVDTTGTLLLALAEKGYQGSKAGQYLSRAMSDLYAPTDQAAKALDSLGVSAYDAQGNQRDMLDVIGDLQFALEGYTEEEKAAYLSTIFTSAGLKAANSIMGNSKKQLLDLKGRLQDCSGAAQQMAETKLDNLKGDLTLLSSATDGLKISLYEVVSGIGNVNTKGQKTAGMLRDLVQTATQVMGNLTEAVNENGLDGLVDAIGDGLATMASKIAEYVPTLVQGGIRLVQGLVQGLSKAAPQIAEAAVSLVGVLAEGVLSVSGDLVELAVSLVTSFATAIVNNLPLIVNGILNGIQSLVSSLMSALPTLIEGAAQLVTGLVEALPQILQTIVNALPGLLETVFSGLINCLPSLISAAVELVAGLIAALPSILITLVEAIPQIFLGLLEGIADGITKAIADIFNLEDIKLGYEIEEQVKGLKTEVDNLCDSLDNLGQKRTDDIYAIEAQVGMYEDIKSELLTYTDANGNIIAGYEDEVLALQALAEQYGITIEIRNGQVTNIDEVCSAIDQLIAKYEQEAYTAAETSAIEGAYKTRRSLIADYYEAYDTYSSEIARAQELYANREYKAAYQAMDNAELALNAASEAASGIVQADEEITLSKQNLAAISQGAYEDICYTTEQAGIEIEATSTEIGSSLVQLANDVKDNSNSLMETAQNDSVIGGMVIEEHVNGMVDAFEEGLGSLNEIAETDLTELNNKVSVKSDETEAYINELTGNVESDVAGMSQSLQENLNELIIAWEETFGTEMPAALETAATAATNAGIQIPQTLVDGLSKGEISEQAAIDRMNALVEFQTAIDSANIGGAEVSQSFVDSWLSGEYSWEQANSYLNGLIEFTDAINTAQESGVELTEEFVNGLLADAGLSGVISAAETIGNSAKPTIVPNEIQTVGVSVDENLASGMSSAESQVTSTASQIASDIEGEFSGLPGDMNASGANAGSNLDSGFAGWKSAISGTVDDTYNFFYNTLGTTMPAMMSTWGSNAGQKYNSGINLWSSNIQTTAQNIQTYVKTPLEMLPALLSSIGSQAGAGLYNGLASWQYSLSSLANSIANSINSAARRALQIRSPSKVMQEVGEYTGEGLYIGFESKEDRILKEVNSFTSDLIDALNISEDAAAMAEEVSEAYNNGIDFDELVYDASGAIDSNSQFTGSVATAGTGTAAYQTESSDSYGHTEGSGNPEYIENNIIVSGKKVAQIMTPYISKQLAWEG